ncbi:pyrroline-5-carboxylate reductase family protein [Brevundimonas sp.]|jgi:pyrroline-5-carboxylate reductase|uniref:pyrroline-5-carboxylate reductase family protein n=1 Tax=Brevundimonas sp. TaxID=1871086 RepID=UPI003919D704
MAADVLLLGCGRLGSAILEGWLLTGSLAPDRMLIATPSSKPAAEAARACGARVTASPDGIAGMSAVVLAVKPGLWRQALAPWLPALVPDAVVLSVMAGVAGADIAAAVAARPVARLMPTTAVAQGQGVAALWSDGPAAEAAARTLFGALADLVPLADETLFHAATAVSGCAPAFIHALVEALAEAGTAEGLEPDAAERLARGALRSAAAGAATGASLAELIDRVASPGGATRAGLDALRHGGLDLLATATVAAAMRRSRELG